MRTLLNIIWLVLSGFWLALGYALAGLIMCILIITIPFGIQAFKLAGYVLWPFGRTVVKRPGAGAGSTIGNVIWFVLAGWWLAVEHLITAVALAVTIIGIPFAIANVKLVAAAVAPFGREIVPTHQLGDMHANAIDYDR
ncbi:MAG TPA: YccF domain-containing protein [Solirubrobacteraceae bacterium]|nr:YccF domain-containing protein [Solirubrobacteraceae bacterium]